MDWYRLAWIQFSLRSFTCNISLTYPLRSSMEILIQRNSERNTGLSLAKYCPNLHMQNDVIHFRREKYGWERKGENKSLCLLSRCLRHHLNSFTYSLLHHKLHRFWSNNLSAFDRAEKLHVLEFATIPHSFVLKMDEKEIFSGFN